MDYKRQLKSWQARRDKIAAWLAAGETRKAIAKKLGITRQRLSQLEHKLP